MPTNKALDIFEGKKKKSKGQKFSSGLEYFNQGKLPGEEKEIESEPLDLELKKTHAGDIPTFQMHSYVQEEPGLEPAWNPLEIFGSIYAGGAKAAYSIAGQTAKQAMQSGLREAAVGTVADAPIYMAGEYLRDNYGWGPGLIGELGLSFTSAFTIENFVLRKLTSVGKNVDNLDSLSELAKKSGADQESAMAEIEKVLNVATDGSKITDPVSKEISVERPVSLNELTEVPRIKPKETISPPTEDTFVQEIIRKADGRSYKNEKSVRSAIKRKGLNETEYEPIKTDDGYVIQRKKSTVSLGKETVSAFGDKRALDDATKIVLKERENLAQRLGFYDSIMSKKDETYLLPKPKEEQDSLEKLTQEYGLDLSDIPKLVSRSELSGVKVGEDPLEDLMREFGSRKEFITPESEFKADQTQLLEYFEPKLLPAPTREIAGESTEEIAETPITRSLDDLEEPTPEQLAKIEEEGIAEESLDVSEDELLRYADELGIKPKTPEGVASQQKANIRTQNDIEEFLDEPMENFSAGEIRAGREDEVGFDNDYYYMYEGFPDESNLMDGEDSTRDLGDFLADVGNVMSGKMGLSLQDMSKKSTRDQIEAAERLVKDFKKHRSEAVRSGIDLAEFYKNKGFSESMANKLRDYNMLVTQRGEEITSELTERGNIDDRIIKGFKNPLRALAIEVPFRKAGVPNTGHAFKVFPSVQGFYEDEGLHIIKGLSKNYSHLDPSDYGLVTLKAENPDYDLGDIPAGKKEDIETLASRVNDYFDKKFQDLNKEGVLERPFPDSYIYRQERKIEKLNAKLENLKQPAAKKRYFEEIEQLEKNIEAAKGVNYVPLLSWLEDEATRSSARFGKTASILAQKQRNVASTRYLYENGHVNLEEIDVRNIIGHYARRAGKDVANQRLKNALLKDGLIRKIPSGRRPKDFPEHWPEVDKNTMPMFKDHVMQPRVKDFLESFYNSIGKRTPFERGLTAIKMAQFFNPVIMPMYDTYQSAVLHGLNGWRIPGHIKDGIRSVIKQDQDFKDLSMFGGYSKPFASPLANWQDELANAKYPGKRRIQRLMNPLPHKAFKNYYNLVWDMAWQGDRMIRMASYKELRRRGMRKRDAAQLTALFHGDYASVPPNTRRAMNHIFFTPTFKVVMAKWHANMLAAAMETGERAMRKSIPGVKSKKLGMKRRALAGGAVGLVAANMAKDALMTSMGFERDQGGRRYTQEVETEEGPKEVVLTFSDPTNVTLKYLWKAQQALDAQTDRSGFGNLLQSFNYDLHPAWRLIFSDLQYNRRAGGGKIYSEGESTFKKFLKSSVYIAEETIPLLDPVSGLFGIADSSEEQKNRKILNKEFGKLGKFLLNLVAFTYVRGPEEQRAYFKAQNIWKNMQQDVSAGTMNDEKAQRYQEQLQSVYDDLED